MAISIRMTSFAGDWDERAEINVIGPYGDTSARDAGLEHLESLAAEAGLDYLYDFKASELHTDGVHRSMTPEEAAAASTFNYFIQVLYS